MADSPPKCWHKKFGTLKTRPCKTSQTSTSSMVNPQDAFFSFFAGTLEDAFTVSSSDPPASLELSASWLLSPCSLGSLGRAVGLSRVLLWLTVWVVGFVGDVRSECNNTNSFGLFCSSDHHQHPPLCCLEFLLHVLRHRSCSRSVEKRWCHGS